MKFRKTLSIAALLLFSCSLLQSVAIAQGCDCSRKDDNSPWVCTPKGCMGEVDQNNYLQRESQLTLPTRASQPQIQPRDLDEPITNPYQVNDKYLPGDQFKKPQK